MNRYRILFVCTDNLCRSPTAEAIMRYKLAQHGVAERVLVASAATHDFNVDEPVDIRSQKHAMRRDYDLSTLRARLLQADDFERHDLILAMEESNLLTLRMRCPEKHHHKLHLFTEYCNSHHGQDVPDPFYGKSQDFEQVMDILEDGCENLLEQLPESVQ